MNRQVKSIALERLVAYCACSNVLFSKTFVKTHLGFTSNVSCLCPELGKVPDAGIAEDCDNATTWTQAFGNLNSSNTYSKSTRNDAIEYILLTIDSATTSNE